MALNLFGPPTKNDIRLGYIDPDRGYVEGFTICQANEYAIKNPGTTFIFRNGNNVIQYLNINEVNQLDPNSLTSTDQCGGINQKKECGPPVIQFFGGGGIGAAGNPIVGRDGALLAVDIVRGGNGYQYPPLVAARDNCNYGSGATLTAVLGEVTETIETYENESDFEDYELCEPSDVGYGRRYGPNGEDLGPWEPQVYTEPSEDPIRNEIEEYEKIVRRLARTPFWTTRSAKPTKITCSDARVIPSRYDVTFPAWNEFMNSYAISPVSPSNVRGSDFAGRLFTFEWTEDFPLDGEYIFRGLCDNKAQLYIDNLKVSDLSGFADAVKPIKKTITKGLHNIRVDLLNVPILETILTQEGNSSDLKSQKVFNTLDYIGRANRTLWRTNPTASSGDSLIHQFGVSPFDTTTQEAQTNSFAGVHTIIWNNINFPVDGSYNIRMAVDDNVRLFIGDQEIRYNGFVSSSVANKDFAESRFFKAGNYTIRAELEQIKGKPLGKGNPMALAIDIETVTTTKSIVSPKSWNKNPMGISITIDAPEPTVPKEPVPVQEGRCPPNPIWTTRFSGSKEQWYPVKFNGSKSPQGKKQPWAKFFNRYAISPVPPLDTPGSDAGGILFTNSWEIDIPYDGFYKFAVQRDETARIYLDGKIVFDIKTAGDDIWRDFRDKPKFQKVFITKGRHTIGIELENSKTEVFGQVYQKIFRTKDWQITNSISNNIDVNFDIKTQGDYASTFMIKELDINLLKPVESSNNQTISKKVEIGKVYLIEIEVPQSKDGVRLEVKGKTLEMEEASSKTSRDLFCTTDKGRFFDIQNGAKKATCKFIVEENETEINSRVLLSGTSRNGVTYEGPRLFHFQTNSWGEFMNSESVSPLLLPLDSENPEINGTKTYVWKGVNFPESGQYDIKFLADNVATLKIGNTKVLTSQGFSENPQIFKVNVTQGIYDIIVESTNTPERMSIFRENPTGFALDIRKNVTIRQNYGKSWDENPIGIGAVLIPPPCPRKIRGRGVVTDVIVNDPGNGYLRPIPQNQGYPVALRLKEVIVENPGINYNCGVDELRITPSNGAELDYICDPFGKIREVKVRNPGLGFTEYPEIRLISDTGVNASFRPVFEVVRDPIVAPERLIQVTDLVGLKQTGYVNGRPYYGAVYYDQGIRYAGFYETIGEPVRVYDTLQESITAEVTTPPSAIQRQGTDVTSNDPRLNIPGTPENLI